MLLYSGLSRCLSQLEDDLVKWHSEERSTVSEAQTELATAEQESAAMEAAIREATPNLPQDDSWQSRLSSLVQSGKEQRDELEELCSLMRRHVPQDEASGSLDLQQLPEAGQPIKLASNSLARLFSSFLTSIEQAQPLDDNDKANDEEDRSEAAAATNQKLEPEAEPQGRRPRRRRPVGGREKQEAAVAEPRSQQPVAEGRPRKRRRMGKDRAPPEPVRGGDRDNEFSEAYSFDDVYSDSRTPSPRRQAPPRRRRMARRRPDHGYARSASFTPSCERRGPRRRPPHAPPGGGERRRTHHASAGPAAPRGGAGVRRTKEDFGGDVDAALDRFIRVNRLEGRCDKDLRACSEKTAWQVMGCSGPGHTFELSGDIRDPVAVVLGRIRKAQDSGGEAGRQPSGRGARQGRQGAAGARRRNSRSRSRH